MPNHDDQLLLNQFEREMALSYRAQKRVARHRKLQTLRALSTKKPHVKRDCTISKTFLHICSMKLKLESLRRECSILEAEYLKLINRFPKQEFDNYLCMCGIEKEIKVEKLGRGFVVRLVCKKGKGRLVSVLEAFDKMGLIVLQAKVSCNYLFSVEAIVVPKEDHYLDTSDVTGALHKVIEESMEKEEKHQESLEVDEEEKPLAST